MFPEWDKDTLATILENNNFHIEMTIEQCLSMSGGGSIVDQDPNTAPVTIPGGKTARR